MEYDHTQSARLYLLLLVIAIGLFGSAFYIDEIVVQSVILCSGALMLLFAFSFCHLSVRDEVAELLIAFRTLAIVQTSVAVL